MKKCLVKGQLKEFLTYYWDHNVLALAILWINVVLYKETAILHMPVHYHYFGFSFKSTSEKVKTEYFFTTLLSNYYILTTTFYKGTYYLSEVG